MTAEIIVPEKTQVENDCNEQTLSWKLPVPTVSKNRNIHSLSLSNTSAATSSSRPKLHTLRSTDTTSRFPTLEKLENSMLLFPKSSKITVEPVTFSGEPNNINSSNSKKLGSQSDASIRSVKSNKKKQVKRNHQSTPTEIFAKNLSEAVLDVDDSLDGGYVYNNANGTNSLYPPLFSPPLLTSIETSLNSRSGNDEGYFSNHYLQKCKRPGLRSTMSELPARSVKPYYLESMSSLKFEKRGSANYGRCHTNNRYSSSGEDDEESMPLLYYSSSPRSCKRFNYAMESKFMSGRLTWCKWIGIFTVLCTLAFGTFLICLSRPLRELEIVTIGNVLGTRKQLIFDLHVKAKNPNVWSVFISHSAFSVFATRQLNSTTEANAKASTADGSINNTKTNQEYLGTVNHLDDPLLFKPASMLRFGSIESVSTSQIRIRNPGETEDDPSGNERWSLLIRHPFELTIRGVLRYKLFPNIFTFESYSARICKVVQVDPSTGAVDDVSHSKQSAVCEASRE